jgi:hypothetical protein
MMIGERVRIADQMPTAHVLGREALIGEALVVQSPRFVKRIVLSAHNAPAFLFVRGDINKLQPLKSRSRFGLDLTAGVTGL